MYTSGRDLLARVVAEGLDDAHALTPLLTGKELMKEGGVRPGPGVGEATRAVLEYQLAHRDATREGAVALVQRLQL